MKQFDVCRIVSGASKKNERLVVILQHPHIDQLDTILAAPLYSPNDLPLITRIRVMVRINRRTYIVAVDRLAAVSKKQISAPVANLKKTARKFHERGICCSSASESAQ